MNIQDLMDRSTQYDVNKNDFLELVEEIRYDENAHMVLPPVGLFGRQEMALPMTPWALGQVCSKLGPPPYRYISECPPFLQSINLNHWQRKATADSNTPDKKWLVREFNGAVRGVLSDKYTPIANTKMLEILSELIGTTPYKLIRPYVDPDTLHLKITVADDGGGNYAIGCYIGNGEIGNRSIRVSPFVQRHSCTNSIIYQDAGVNQRHMYVTPAFVYGLLKEKIGQAVRVASDMLDAIVIAEMQDIPDIGDTIREICKKRGLLQQHADVMLMGTEGKSSLMGLINGVSYAAHAINDITQETRIDLESLAGSFFAGIMQEVS